MSASRPAHDVAIGVRGGPEPDSITLETYGRPIPEVYKVRPAGVVYSATKSAVRVISEGLRQEVKPWNIRTTVISPGAVATELPQSITEPDIAQGIEQFYKDYAIPAASLRGSSA